MSEAPQGRQFTVTIDGEEQTFLVNASVLSDKTLTSLRALLLERRRNQRKQMLADARAFSKDFGDGFGTELAKQYAEHSSGDSKVDLNDVMDLLETFDPDALSTLLYHAVDSIPDRAYAARVIEAHGDVSSLFELVMDVAKDEGEAEKN